VPRLQSQHAEIEARARPAQTRAVEANSNLLSARGRHDALQAALAPFLALLPEETETGGDVASVSSPPAAPAA
jgi:hypothetical protein